MKAGKGSLWNIRLNILEIQRHDCSRYLRLKKKKKFGEGRNFYSYVRREFGEDDYEIPCVIVVEKYEHVELNYIRR